jgi:hypothetical protein
MRAYTLRVARPVTNLDLSSEMYRAGLGLEIIGGFTDHQGFSGKMLGNPDLPWHLEFTVCHTHPVKPLSTDEDLLVLYVPDQVEWERVCEQMNAAGFAVVDAFNPYWAQLGKTFIDADGYRTVIQRQKWGPE